MSDAKLQELLDAMQRMLDERASTQEDARAFLVEEGVITPSGELTEPYR